MPTVTSEEAIQKLNQILDSKSNSRKALRAWKEAEIIKLLDAQYHAGYRDGYGEGRNESYDDIVSLKKEIEKLSQPPKI